jgi:hypothetical protein
MAAELSRAFNEMGFGRDWNLGRAEISGEEDGAEEKGGGSRKSIS